MLSPGLIPVKVSANSKSMETKGQTFLSNLPLAPLGACIAAFLAFAAPAALANTIVVANCLDSGVNSLRAAIAGAADGDTVDMTTMQCSPITLTTGELVINKSLTLLGPGAAKLQINGNQTSRVINHTGAFLEVQDLWIANGYVYSPSGVAAGGCIYSSGKVNLNGSVVSGCLAQTDSGVAKGGGVYAAGTSTTSGNGLFSSRLTYNTAVCGSGGASGGTAEGGGGMFKDGLHAQFSTISNNSVACRTGGTAKAGGMYLPGGLQIDSSTISNNSSSGDVGGISGGWMAVTNSTISGNTAAGFFGGMVSALPTTDVENSTIVFNSAGAGLLGSNVYQSPGLHVAAGSLTLYSSLIANNTYGVAGKENDFSLQGSAVVNVAVDNLVRAASSPLPSGNLLGACPLLGPLRDNGGPTLTHALLSHSPGIDVGISRSGSLLAYDQRQFPRLSGSRVDIGSYEVWQNDIVFNSGFDGCPAL